MFKGTMFYFELSTFNAWPTLMPAIPDSEMTVVRIQTWRSPALSHGPNMTKLWNLVAWDVCESHHIIGLSVIISKFYFTILVILIYYRDFFDNLIIVKIFIMLCLHTWKNICRHAYTSFPHNNTFGAISCLLA
jgi:hypothetical protein